MFTKQILCDQCRGVIRSLAKDDNVKNDYLSIEGVFSKNIWNEALDQYVYVHICRAKSEYAFCNDKCLKEYVAKQFAEQYDRLVETITNKGTNRASFKQDNNYESYA